MKFAQYWTLLRIYLAPQHWRVLWMVLFLIASMLLQLVGPQLIRVFIDNFQKNADLQVLTLTALAYLAVAVGSQVVSALTSYFCEDVGWHATNQLRADLTEHCLCLDRSFHTKYTPGELLERVDSNVNTLASFFSQLIIRVLGNALLIIGVLVLMAREHMLFGIVLSVYLIASILLFVQVQKVAVTYYKPQWEAEAELSGFWGELLHALEDITSNRAVGYIMRRYLLLQRHENKTELKATAAWASFEGVMLVIDVLCTLLVLLFSAYLFVQGSINLATLVLLLTYVTLLLNHTIEIAEQLGSLQEATTCIERINEIYHIQSKVQDGPGVIFPTGALPVTFDHVTFTYEADHPVLHDITFHIAAGSSVGLIGRSGSGKTTLTRLLMRFYDPDNGHILLAEQDLRLAHLHDLRSRIGLVTQDVQLFQASLRDNLTFFDASIDDARILKAIHQLGIDAWFTRLPLGLDTPLDSKGGGLSAGEAQLLACVRVFLKDPQFIIFDEATSRLDPATEQLITRATEQLLAGRTALIIAHRLSTVERLDSIMVLESGHIVEYGPRTHLATKSDSRYSRLLSMSTPEELLA